MELEKDQMSYQIFFDNFIVQGLVFNIFAIFWDEKLKLLARSCLFFYGKYSLSLWSPSILFARLNLYTRETGKGMKLGKAYIK